MDALTSVPGLCFSLRRTDETKESANARLLGAMLSGCFSLVDVPVPHLPRDLVVVVLCMNGGQLASGPSQSAVAHM